jgi:GNAT superfamily N-acetyltransferase
MCAPALPHPTPRDTTDPASVCRSLAEAFVDDPFYRAVTVESATDEARRQQVLTRYFELAIEEGNAIGEIQCAGTDGAAVWITNQVSHAEIAEHGDVRNRALAKLLGADGYANYSRICAAMAERVPAHLAQAWYLSILGVRPAARGQRLARAILELTLNRADQLGANCFLETFNPLSIPFYERLGFRQEMSCFEEVTARPYSIMVRRAA